MGVGVPVGVGVPPAPGGPPNPAGLTQQQHLQMAVDEEDHEAISKLFVTIGKILDTPKSKQAFKAYFEKIKKFSQDNTINSRI